MFAFFVLLSVLLVVAVSLYIHARGLNVVSLRPRIWHCGGRWWARVRVRVSNGVFVGMTQGRDHAYIYLQTNNWTVYVGKLHDRPIGMWYYVTGSPTILSLSHLIRGMLHHIIGHVPYIYLSRRNGPTCTTVYIGWLPNRIPGVWVANIDLKSMSSSLVSMIDWLKRIVHTVVGKWWGSWIEIRDGYWKRRLRVLGVYGGVYYCVHDHAYVVIGVDSMALFVGVLDNERRGVYVLDSFGRTLTPRDVLQWPETLYVLVGRLIDRWAGWLRRNWRRLALTMMLVIIMVSLVACGGGGGDKHNKVTDNLETGNQIVNAETGKVCVNETHDFTGWITQKMCENANK